MSAPTSNECGVCKQPAESKFVVLGGVRIHGACFACVTCTQSLVGKPFVNAKQDGKFYCQTDYYRAFNPKCGHCEETILGQYINALDKSWCVAHFVCSQCGAGFPDDKFHTHEGRPYCREHYLKVTAESCAKCNKPIEGDIFEALGDHFHLECFKCQVQDHTIPPDEQFHVVQTGVYCQEHFTKLFDTKCKECSNAIHGKYVKAGDVIMHAECWKCAACHKQLSQQSYTYRKGAFYCQVCGAKEQAAAAAGAQASDGDEEEEEEAPPPPAGPPPPEALMALQAGVATMAVAGGGDAKDGKDAAAPKVQEFYTLGVLRSKDQCPKEISTGRKEEYLSDEDFNLAFGMSKEAFAKMAKWRKIQMKKRLGLF